MCHPLFGRKINKILHDMINSRSFIRQKLKYNGGLFNFQYKAYTAWGNFARSFSWKTFELLVKYHILYIPYLNQFCIIEVFPCDERRLLCSYACNFLYVPINLANANHVNVFCILPNSTLCWWNVLHILESRCNSG